MNNMAINLLDLLKRLEWSGTADFQFYTVPSCPICGGLKNDTKIDDLQIIKCGHKPDCDLEKAIIDLTKSQNL
jgi:hypothetical protein